MEDLLAKILVNHGLKAVFGITGSGSSLKLISAIETLGAKYYPACHEASAAIMAGAVWSSSGHISASISIKGPGLVNMLAGIAYNYFENLPIISIVEDFDSNIPHYKKHKRISHSSFLASLCKGSICLDDVDVNFDRLIDYARMEVPGPVHIDLCQGVGQRIPWPKESESPENEPLHILKLIDKAQRPIVILGSLSKRRPWGKHFVQPPVPTFTTAAAKGIINERHPLSLGVLTGDGKELSLEANVFKMCDLAIGIGLRNIEVISPKPFGIPTVLIDEVRGDLMDGFGATVDWITTEETNYEEIIQMISQKTWGTDELSPYKLGLKQHYCKDDWSPVSCFSILNNLSGFYTLVLDTGAFCTIGEHFWLAGPERHFIGSSNGRFMGAAIPSAIGTAVSCLEKPVFCVVGDGGIKMYPSEIKLAVAERLPICFILMTDGMFGSIAGPTIRENVSRRAITVVGSSWLSSVSAMGCESILTKTPEDFAQAVMTWPHKEPLFIEAPFDPERYAAMTEKLR